MAAVKEGVAEVEVAVGVKPREKVLFGEDHVWFGFEARRVEPGEMSAEVVMVMERNKGRRRIQTSKNGRFISFASTPFSFCKSHYI